MLFEYVAWFCNPALPADDQDYEWPACFVVQARSAEAAEEWGDHLARSYATRCSEIFLRSCLDLPVGAPDRRLPVICVGEEASDRKIGW
jgi:hypothetical protein